MRADSNDSGFTLIELIVTLAVFAILVSVAVPAFRDIVISNTVASERDQLFTLLGFARSEAIKGGTSTSICRSGDGSSCDDSLGWNRGWLVFADANRNGSVDAGADKVLRYVDGLDDQVSVASTSGDDRITYASRGLLLRGSGSFSFSHPSDSKFDRSIDLSVTGRATKGK